MYVYKMLVDFFVEMIFKLRILEFKKFKSFLKKKKK